jgi:hypothetical protein
LDIENEHQNIYTLILAPEYICIQSHLPSFP